MGDSEKAEKTTEVLAIKSIFRGEFDHISTQRYKDVIMSAVLRGAMRWTGAVLNANVTPKATMVIGPPRVKISFAEKAATFTIMSTLIMAPTMWLIGNIPNYRGDDDSE